MHYLKRPCLQNDKDQHNCYLVKKMVSAIQPSISSGVELVTFMYNPCDVTKL